jgi:hypothetical protein
MCSLQLPANPASLTSTPSTFNVLAPLIRPTLGQVNVGTGFLNVEHDVRRKDKAIHTKTKRMKNLYEWSVG